MGAVEILLVWENLDVQRIELRSKAGPGGAAGEDRVVYLTPEEEADSSNFKDEETGLEFDVVDKTPLVDWFTVNYKVYPL